MLTLSRDIQFLPSPTPGLHGTRKDRFLEYEELDISVRNLATEWRSEFGRLVERDRHTGRTSDTLPFHLTMLQLSTAFVQYSIEIGRNIAAPPPPNSRDRYSTSGARTIRSIIARSSTDDNGAAANAPSATDEDEDDVSPNGYQLNALRGSLPDSPGDDFDHCFTDADLCSCVMPDVSLPLFESVLCGDALPFCIPSDIPLFDSESFLFRCLSETYDPNSRSGFADADYGSMACTTSDSTLLYLYRALSGNSTKVRFFDAGSHSHHPDGVGFLCLPAYRVPLPSLVTSDNAHTFTPCCVFVRTDHTTSIRE